MSKSDDRKAKRAQQELDRRLLAVEDPVEMKTVGDTEMLVPATPEEIAEDEQRFEDEVRHLRTATPAGALHRDTTMKIRGLGQVD